MYLCPFSHVAGINIHQLFKHFRSRAVVLLLKSPHPHGKIPDSRLI
jgi:hypothetical protein